MGISVSSLSLVFVPLALGAAGAASRWTFQMTETRLQIAAFVVIAAAIEAFASNLGYRASWLRFALSAAAVTCCIVAVRLYLEGLPGGVARWLAAGPMIQRLIAYFRLH
jgi:predicted membrane channel-forming protein YqfA (hemolysin III family)